ncbi:MAG: DUF3488 and DUF4129 domain-containing transglutaminase family protein [Halopenitus sp.]
MNWDVFDRDSGGVGPGNVLPEGLCQPPVAGVALATAAFLSVCLSITDVVGGSARVVVAVAVALVAGVAAARVLDVRTIGVVSAVLFAGSLTAYYFSVPESQRALFTATNVVFDTVSLLTGLSVLRLAVADVWVLSVAPVPTFLAWALAARGRHLRAASVAGATLGFFVLTGDAGTPATLLGVVGVALTAGLSTLSVPGGLDSEWSTLAVVVATMVLLSATLSIVPGGAAQPWQPDRGTPGIESSLVGQTDQVNIVGSVRLSPEVRFTVESTQEAYWRTGSYDRYTGDGWVRTGESQPYTGRLQSPPGTTITVKQTVTAKTPLDAFPAAWKPVSVDGTAARSAQVSSVGGIYPATTIPENDTVQVESQVLQTTPELLRNAGTDYPNGLEERYTQLPESTPERVGELTSEIVEKADANNSYDKAVAIERYLEANKEYSLTVQKPEGDVADSFLFEMDAGYCVYFATTMVVMLRSQGIPAKFVTGYSSGEQVDSDEWVVRGQDAHAWVMVYFPDQGWVRFDPTPSAPREEAREARLVEARQNDAQNVDTSATLENEGTETPTPTPSTPDSATDNGTNGTGPGAVAPDGGSVGNVDPGEVPGPSTPATVQNGDLADQVAGNDDSGGSGILPDRETIGYGLLALFGLVAAGHHVGATNRAYRGAWLRIPFRRRDPIFDVERAYARLEYLLEQRYRARRPGETPREYLTALDARGVDDSVHQVADAYEQAMYAGEIDRETADEAVRVVRQLVLETTPILRWFV